jgi:hypothetical protein
VAGSSKPVYGPENDEVGGWVEGRWVKCVVAPVENMMSHVNERQEILDDHIADLTGLEETRRQISSSVSQVYFIAQCYAFGVLGLLTDWWVLAGTVRRFEAIASWCDSSSRGVRRSVEARAIHHVVHCDHDHFRQPHLPYDLKIASLHCHQLPLSFVASVFSMSTAATDYRDGLMTFGEEFLYMGK